MNNLQRGIYQPVADKVPIYDIADEEPEDEERSRAPLLVVVALVVLVAFAGVVWIAYNQGVERGRQGASLVITAPEGPVRVAPPQSATPAPLDLNVYKEPVSPEQEAKSSRLAQPKSAAETPQIRLGQAANPTGLATAPPAAAPAPRPAPAAPAAQTAQPRPAPSAAAVAPPPPAATAALPPTAAVASPPAATAQPAGRALSGAAVLQIGAFDNEELANGAWQTFRSRFSAAQALSPDVQRADLGARGIVYRLRVGPFADRAAATEACVQLKAEGGNCFVTVP